MKNYSFKPTDENALEFLKTDPIRRNVYVQRFIQMLTRMEDDCYTVALNGDWGSGKTFFVKQVKMLLDASNPQSKMDAAIRQNILDCRGGASYPESYATVYYDAWACDNHEDPILSLVYAALKSGLGEVSQGKTPSVIKTAMTVFDAIKGTNLTALCNMSKDLHTEDLTTIIEKTENLKGNIRKFIDSLIHEKGNRLIVFVDELDRCKPDYAIHLLERIKHYFDDDRITFVFSVNLTQLQWTVKGYYGSNFDATKYLEKFFDFQFAIPYADYKRFLWDRLNLNSDSITEHICTAVIRQFDFSLRQSERYVRIMKIVGVNDACENAISQEDKATAFVGEYIMPILVGLQMYNLDVYYEFKAGRNAEPMIKILSNPEIPKCRFLLEQRETFAADGVIPSSSSGYVVMKDRLQTAYDALFLKTDRIKVGQMTFTDRTRAYLNETESMLIPDGNFDFE